MESIFTNTVSDLKFTPYSIENGGVVLCNSIPPECSPEILFGIDTAKRFFADAVYFRHFSDGRVSIPQIYFFDYTLRNVSNEDKKDIHKRMWSGYVVPIYIIVEKSSVSIFDARTKAQTGKEHYVEELLRLSGTGIKEFDAAFFDDGMFWEEEQYKKKFQFEESATKDLIRGLKEVHKNFQEKSGLDKHVSLKLLVQSLLIKYLEERDESSQCGYFAKTYFKKNFDCTKFCEIIREGKLLALLDHLAEDFNGKIFEWDKEKEKEARESIQKSEVKILASYLDGNIENNQYVIWRLYSFSHLPVEVISSVYEELLTDSKDIVYTPEMVVSTLIDESMPLKEPRENFRLIDVSCGSGIFLVKAYKRIIQWGRYAEWLKTGKLSKPSLDVLKRLLKNSIYGIDIEDDAVRLAVFSLALAMLDEVDLNPPTWQKLKFPDFSKNIKKADFFKYISANIDDTYDLVIGNPPFNLHSVLGREPKRKKFFKTLRENIGYRCEFDIPDENPALHFLVQSMNLLRSDGQLCMIQPAAPILYNNNMSFKQALFSKYNLQQVIDFTLLPDIWAGARVATMALFIKKSLPDSNSVLHLVANRTFSNKNRIFLEFDHYDFHFISKDDIINNPFIWKADLLGGGRIIDLIERFRKMRTLGAFLAEKEKHCGWKYNEGYTVGNKKYPAPFIHGQKAIDPRTFGKGRNGDFKTFYESNTHFEAPRLQKKEIYLAPHIIIKENIGKTNIPIVFLDEDMCFSHEMVGIYAPNSEINELKKVYDIFQEFNVLYRFYILVTSSRLIVGRATSILKRDMDRLPFPTNLSDLKVQDLENQIIKEAVDNYANKGMKDETASQSQILHFSDIFCKTLNNIYEENNKSFKLFKIIDTSKYYALHFEYTADIIESSFTKLEELNSYVKDVIPTQKGALAGFHIQRVLKLYGQNSIILVKPKNVRYWSTNIALRDSDECYSDYVNARYGNAAR